MKTPLIETKQNDMDELWYWHLRAKNGEIVADGAQGYTREGSALRAARLLAGRALPIWPMVIDHTCKNMGCVNVKHLRAVTQTVNSTENSNSPFAINKRKTHCKYGHPLTPDNVRASRSKGAHGNVCKGRVCLKCYGPGGERRGKNARPAP